MASKDNANVIALRNALMFACTAADHESVWDDRFSPEVLAVDSNKFMVYGRDGKSYEVSIQIPKR